MMMELSGENDTSSIRSISPDDAKKTTETESPQMSQQDILEILYNRVTCNSTHESEERIQDLNKFHMTMTVPFLYAHGFFKLQTDCYTLMRCVLPEGNHAVSQQFKMFFMATGRSDFRFLDNPFVLGAPIVYAVIRHVVKMQKILPDHLMEYLYLDNEPEFEVDDSTAFMQALCEHTDKIGSFFEWIIRVLAMIRDFLLKFASINVQQLFNIEKIKPKEQMRCTTLAKSVASLTLSIHGPSTLLHPKISTFIRSFLDSLGSKNILTWFDVDMGGSWANAHDTIYQHLDVFYGNIGWKYHLLADHLLTINQELQKLQANVVLQKFHNFAQNHIESVA